MKVYVSMLGILCFVFVTAAFMVCPVSLRAQEKLPDSDPKLIGSSTYTLPQSAIDAEIDGGVLVAIHIDKTGTPTKAVMIAGPIWPCGKTPIKAIDEVSKTLSEEMMKVRFSPAIKDGKPVSTDFGLRLNLKNPKVNSEPVENDPATGKPKARLITAGILNGKAESLLKPEYPAEARSIGASGTVNIQVLIDEKGKVIRAGALNGHPSLQFAARNAACGSKFAPTTLEKKSIKVSGVITYAFIR